MRFGVRALRLERSSDGRRVSGVVFRDRTTGLEGRIPCAAVVVAAGAVATAQILLQSTDSVYREGLGNTHGVLGRYLHDHPLGKLVLDLGSPIGVHPPAYLTRPSLDGSRPLYAAACVQWTGSLIRAKSVLSGRLDRLPWTGFNVFGTMAPAPDNRVELDDGQRGADGEAGLKLHIRHPEEARATLTETRDALVDFLDRAHLRPSVRIWHTEPVGHSIHYGGTCRMHVSPKFGMLDCWGRLHAVPNVIVADSAAFTTGPEKNPVLTAMALSARASDRLARDLRSGEASIGAPQRAAV
jgi:choline dehydrogenase-like flavoprotein